MVKTIQYFLVIVLMAASFSFSYRPGDPEEPTPQEKSAFENLHEKVRNNSDLHPHSINEVLKTFTEKWTYSIQCPQGSMFDQVDFTISTRQIRWDRNLSIKSKPSGVGPGDIGWYQWTYKSSGEGRIKKVDATNYIMLDPRVILVNETNSPFDETGDEALLYHELLHGQLVIDSIMQGAGFQKKVCNCNFDLSAGDFNHQFIPDYEIEYLSSVLSQKGEKDESAFVLKPQASDSGSGFKMPVAEASILEGVENVRINWYLPRGCNVVEDQINVLVEEGKIWVAGTLKDVSKSGLLVIIIDVTV